MISFNRFLDLSSELWCGVAEEEGTERSVVKDSDMVGWVSGDGEVERRRGKGEERREHHNFTSTLQLCI